MPLIVAVLAASLAPASAQQSREPISPMALAAMRRGDHADVIRLVEPEARLCMARYPTGERCIDLVRSLAMAYQGVGDAGAAEPASARALALAESSWAPGRAEIFPYLVLRAWALHNLGRHADATPFYARALAIIDGGVGADPETERTLLRDYSDNLTSRGLYLQAEPLLQREYALLRNASVFDRADVLNRLARNLDFQDRRTEAEPYYRAGIAVCEQLAGRSRMNCRTTLTANLALLLSGYPERRAEAIALMRAVVDELAKWHDDPLHPRVIGSRTQLAGLLGEAGALREAESLYRDAIARVAKARRDEPDLGAYYNGLAVVLDRQNRRAEALAMYEKARVMAARLPVTRPERLIASMNVAETLIRSGRELPRARTMLRAVTDQIQSRQQTFRDFGSAAQRDVRRYSFAYNSLVRVSWVLAQKR